MASLNMPNGPYNLTTDEVDKRIKVGSIGNYAYGHKKVDGTFVVEYVGRSDTDLNDRIKHGIGQYKMFKYSIAYTKKSAFEKECRNYHDFGESDTLDNIDHPDKPDFTDYKCPVCGK